MHMSVHMYLALILVPSFLALSMLFVTQVLNMQSDDESCTESDYDLADEYSAGGWSYPAVADQLPNPAGEPSADRHP